MSILSPSVLHVCSQHVEVLLYSGIVEMSNGNVKMTSEQPLWLLCVFMAISSLPPYRADIITESQAKGLGNFVSKFALPALLFKNMVLLDFGDVIWAFLWSVLVAKVGVCASQCILYSVS